MKQLVSNQLLTCCESLGQWPRLLQLGHSYQWGCRYQE
jgi:hypothetical protein